VLIGMLTASAAYTLSHPDWIPWDLPNGRRASLMAPCHLSPSRRSRTC